VASNELIIQVHVIMNSSTYECYTDSSFRVVLILILIEDEHLLGLQLSSTVHLESLSHSLILK